MIAALESYEKLLLHNATRISSVESSLRSLSWFLPGRFQDSELASEALYSALNVLGLYHDSILIRTVSTLPSPLRPAPSSHARYTRHWASTSKTYATSARLLTILKYTELLIEMGLKKRRGSEVAERAVITVEALKAVMRLTLFLGVLRGRTCVNPPIAEREVDPSFLDLHRPHFTGGEGNGAETDGRHRHHRLNFNGTTPRSAADVLLGDRQNPIREGHGDGELTCTSTSGKTFEEDDNADYWKGPRTGNTLPTIASLRGPSDPLGDPTSFASAIAGGSVGKETIKEYLMTRVLTVEDVKRPQDLISKAKGAAKLAEIVWILRPLIYVLAMRKYGKRHTLPYLLSLALEYLSFSLRKTSEARLAQGKSSGPMLPKGSYLSELEKSETKKRQKMFWWYLLRGPVWEGWTKVKLEGFARSFQDKPLIGFVSTIVGDYIPLIDEYYFYTS